MTCGSPQERLQLLSCPDLHLHPRGRPQPWRGGNERDVPGDEAASHSGVERATDDQVDLVDGLGCQRVSIAGGVEQRVVEPLEVLGP
jgi:hypothetical protein